MLAELVVRLLLVFGPMIAIIVGLIGALAALTSLFRRARPTVGLVFAAIWLPGCGIWYGLYAFAIPFFYPDASDRSASMNSCALIVAAAWLGLALVANAAAKES